jgi:hypothetical protein
LRSGGASRRVDPVDPGGAAAHTAGINPAARYTNLQTALVLAALVTQAGGEIAWAKNCYDRAVAWLREHQGHLRPNKEAELDAVWAEARPVLGKRRPALIPA